jgi:hypothetical protein
MAHEEYTAKSATSSLTLGGADVLTGCRQVTITERGKPAAAKIDITTAGDSAYSYMTDPLGAQGTASCEIVVEGFLSVTDHQDSGILSKAIDSTGTVIVKKAADGDWFTATSAIFRSFETEAPFAGVVPFTATFALDSSSGVWATAS